jgi:hypothetical protein
MTQTIDGVCLPLRGGRHVAREEPTRERIASSYQDSDATIQANALQKRRMAVEEALLTMIEGYQPE